ncbi:hypothetical protein G4Y79_16105 [Phototrophicus methaneseepsis]|uniref:Ribonuclease R winged-helix domain-containing protein n=1 Tax=Phototrophicus methaneseepsis TaxID=2710758 RepID=A0A7S8IDC5_9CHLR|nr:winged-helix domain-containing protein [Phototrophicus methaneseepsis]QPC81224.1 hypothetical protein G4Y79_16105 [Phototrophicus methaneseepsis]
MQDTRRHILEILREREEATVSEIVDELCQRRGESITAVTVRHHLGILQNDQMITISTTKHRRSPGRPQHLYTLTSVAENQFANNYQDLATNLLKELRTALPEKDVNVILEGVADSMASSACVPEGPIEERISSAIEYMNGHGYEAAYEPTEGGYLLYTYNCPYHAISKSDSALCQMDMRLIASMIGVVPRLVSQIADGSAACSYFIPVPS